LKAYAKLPLTFVENRGQTDTRVRYVAQGSRNAFYLTREEIVLSFVKGSGPRDSTLAARAARIRPVATAAAAEQPTLGVGLARSGLVSEEIEEQWSETGFPDERDLFFLAYGRAPLPPSAAIPAGSLDSNGVPNDNQAVLNVVRGAPFWRPGDYSPLWKMHCLDGGITPTIGPGAPCGNTRFYRVGQPHTVSEVKDTGLPIVGGIFRDINCPIIATDVNDDGIFANTAAGKELVQFPDIDWAGAGLVADGVHDPGSTLN